MSLSNVIDRLQYQLFSWIGFGNKLLHRLKISILSRAGSAIGGRLTDLHGDLIWRLGGIIAY